MAPTTSISSDLLWLHHPEKISEHRQRAKQFQDRKRERLSEGFQYNQKPRAGRRKRYPRNRESRKTPDNWKPQDNAEGKQKSSAGARAGRDRSKHAGCGSRDKKDGRWWKSHAIYPSLDGKPERSWRRPRVFQHSTQTGSESGETALPVSCSAADRRSAPGEASSEDFSDGYSEHNDSGHHSQRSAADGKL